MSLRQVFEAVDNIVGDVSLFKGLTFTLDNGILSVDVFAEEGDSQLFICEFTPFNATEPITFAAKGEVELGEQLSHYVRQ